MTMVCQPESRARLARRIAGLLLLVAGLVGVGLLAPSHEPRAGAGAWAAQESPFEFVLMGDTPYSRIEEIAFEAMLAEIGRGDFAFVVHVGDFKSGGSRCSDELFAQRLALFQTSVHPFVFVFGDNEWTDCHRPDAGGYDPVERLGRLRELFAAGDRSLGRRTIALERQGDNPRWAKFRENVRWLRGGVVFVGLNVPGSNNNFGRAHATNAEYVERNAANLAWMHESFALAAERGASGILLAIQADPFFELPRGHRARRGYESFLGALEAETVQFRRPVVLVHGDTHVFRIDKPLRDTNGQTVPNFTRVEVFGSPTVGWVRGHVTPGAAAPFSFQSGEADRSRDGRRQH